MGAAGMCGEDLYQTQGHTSGHSREQDKGKEVVYLSSGFLAFINLHLQNRNSYCKDQMRLSVAVAAHCLLCNCVLRLHVELCL